MPYNLEMYTVAETDVFIRYAHSVWSTEERDAFVTWIANNPLAGDVIPGTGGLRKVRYSRQGTGKRGGVRVVYYNLLPERPVTPAASAPHADRPGLALPLVP